MTSLSSATARMCLREPMHDWRNGRLICSECGTVTTEAVDREAGGSEAGEQQHPLSANYRLCTSCRLPTFHLCHFLL